jgi:hypothetical protein
MIQNDNREPEPSEEGSEEGDECTAAEYVERSKSLRLVTAIHPGRSGAFFKSRSPTISLRAPGRVCNLSILSSSLTSASRQPLGCSSAFQEEDILTLDCDGSVANGIQTSVHVSAGNPIRREPSLLNGTPVEVIWGDSSSVGEGTDGIDWSSSSDLNRTQTLAYSHSLCSVEQQVPAPPNKKKTTNVPNRATIRASLICMGLVILAVALAMVVHNANKTGAGSEAATTQIDTERTPPRQSIPPTLSPSMSSDVTLSPSMSSGTMAPTAAPSIAPTALYERLAYQSLLDALEPCTSDVSLLLNASTPQGRLLGWLVQEELEAATFDSGSTGTVHFSVDRGPDMIRERYGLMMLFLSTQGSSWTNTSGWGSPADVCTWHGVTRCSTRVEGSCAVQEVNLSK